MLARKQERYGSVSLKKFSADCMREDNSTACCCPTNTKLKGPLLLPGHDQISLGSLYVPFLVGLSFSGFTSICSTSVIYISITLLVNQSSLGQHIVGIYQGGFFEL